MKGRDKLEQKTKKKKHIFLKLLVVLIAVAGIILYAYHFPKTMELLDKNINLILEKAGMDFECGIFASLSSFAEKTINNIVYIIEIIDMNTKTERIDTSPVPVVIFTNAAFFPSEGETVTSDFGSRINPISGNYENHGGIDIAALPGSNIFAAWPGKVLETGFDSIYGNYIMIKHSENFITKYCHLSEITCKKDDFVKAEDVIGKAGSTGWSTGSHLHFEVEVDGRKVDPMECFDI